MTEMTECGETVAPLIDVPEHRLGLGKGLHGSLVPQVTKRCQSVAPRLDAALHRLDRTAQVREFGFDCQSQVGNSNLLLALSLVDAAIDERLHPPTGVKL